MIKSPKINSVRAKKKLSTIVPKINRPRSGLIDDKVIDNKAIDILLFSIKSKTTESIEYQQAIKFISDLDEFSEEYALIFIGLKEELMWEIRKLYKLHPIIDTECERSWFNNKDSIILFKDYLMLTLNDADYENDDIESPVSIKILKFTNGLLIFAEDYTYSIDTVFKLANSSNDSQKEGAKHKSIFFNEDVEIEIPNF